MTRREEFQSAVEHLEEVVTTMGLLLLVLRRLLRDMGQDDADIPKADFDYMTGTIPQK